MPGRLIIERFRIKGLIPAGHENPDRVRSALERVTATRLAQQGSICLSDFRDDDPRVIVVDRLEIAMADARIDDVDLLVRQLGDGIAAAANRIAHEEAGGRLLIFDSSADRLAAFLRKVLAGEALDQWWLRDFADLQILPRSAALRTALMRDAVVGRDALATLTASESDRLCQALTEIDAGVLLDAIAETLADGEQDDIWQAALTLPRRSHTAGQVAGELRDLAELLSSFGAGLSRVALTAIRIRHMLRRNASPELADAIRQGAGRKLGQLLTGASVADVACLLAPPGEARDLAVRMCEAESCVIDTVADSGFTPHGGMLLLWPHLPEIEQQLVPDGPGDPAGIYAMLALAGIFEPHTAMAAMGDATIRAIFGVDQRVCVADLADWLATVPPNAIMPLAKHRGDLKGLSPPFGGARTQHRALVAAGHQTLAEFTRRLPGFAGSSAAFLRVNLLTIGARTTIRPGTVHALLERPPLDVLLAISGLADRTVPLADGRLLTLERER